MVTAIIRHQGGIRHGSELRAQSEMRAAGEDDGTKAYMEVVFLQPAGAQDAPLLDGVFGSFLNTNFFQGERYSFDKLLTTTEKLFFRFMHAEIPYLATVYRQRTPDGDKVVLKLPNNGFSYREKVLGPELFWHKRDGWVALPGTEAMAQFPTLQRVVSKRYSKVLILYNSEACSIDMEFEPKQTIDPLFMVTYEPGSPYIDTRSMRKPF